MHVCFLYVVIFIYVFCTINIKFSLKKQNNTYMTRDGGCKCGYRRILHHFSIKCNNAINNVVTRGTSTLRQQS